MNGRRVLDGVKVLEWTTAATGPMGGRSLSDYGAEVIRVESAGFLSYATKEQRDSGASRHDAGKRSITLNLEKSEGVELFKRLVGWADVVLQNRRPGVMKKKGLDYDELRRIKEDIIMVNVSIVGQEGPYSDFAERMALDRRMPLVRLLDQAGGSVLGIEAMERTYCLGGPAAMADVSLPLMARVPVVSACLGSVAGAPPVVAAMSHWNIMTKKTSELCVAGPPLIKQALNIDITKQELGNWKVHACQSGVVDNVAEDEEDAFRQIKIFLSYLPQNVWHQPPRVETGDDPNRRDEELLSIIPRDRRKTYDIRQLIKHIVDKDSIFELAPFYGRSVVTILARIDGYPVALMSNDCKWFGGAETSEGCEKMMRFVDFADTFHLPIIYLVDVPGFMIGPESEKAGIERKSARLACAIAQLTVPGIPIILKRSYGVAGGIHCVSRLQLRYAWPSGEWGPLPIEGGVMAAYRREIETAPDPEARRLEIENRLAQLRSPFRTAEVFSVEEIIDPRDTRPLLCEFVRQAQDITATQLGPKSREGIRP